MSEYRITLRPFGTKDFTSKEEYEQECERLQIAATDFQNEYHKEHSHVFEPYGINIYPLCYDRVLKGFPFTFSRRFIIEEFRDYTTKRERLWLQITRPFENLDRVVKVISFVAMIIIILSLHHWCIDYHKQDVHEREVEHLACDVNRTSSDASLVTQTLSSNYDSELGKWSDCGGDYKQCRKNFAKMMQNLYADGYERSPERVRFSMKGDSLELYSISYRDMIIAYSVKVEYWQFFHDCKFSKVYCFETSAGGSHGWVVYERGDKKVTW